MPIRSLFSAIRLVLASLLITVGLGGMAHAAGGKVALVIGNAQYRHTAILQNPVRDARKMAEALRGAGFTVTEGFDLDKLAMGKAIDRFAEGSADADTAVIYYAGHGMQVDGKNYLIPVDAEMDAATHLRTRAYELDDFLAGLPADPAVGIVILDACRDNPLARKLASGMGSSRSVTVSSGLAPFIAESRGKGAGGVVIAYATDPGAIAFDGTGDNSPYAQALIRHLLTPGVELQSALVRVRGEVVDETNGRQKPWHSASIGREVFLAGEAAAPTLAIQSGTESGGKTEAAPQPDATDAARTERKFWDEVSRRDTIQHYEAYLQQYPDGAFAVVARLNMQVLKDKQTAKTEAESPTEVTVASQGRMALAIPESVRTTAGTAETEIAIGLERPDRMDVQRRLAAIGLSDGRPDGIFGANSRKSIGEWQKRHGIVETTYLTADQLYWLKQESDPALPKEPEVRKPLAKKAVAATPKKATAQKKTVTKSASTASVKPAKKTVKPAPKQAKTEPKQYKNNGKAGAFAAGIAAGVVGCVLLNGC